jgi:predicted DsbA family dithiol-disulfide isomerase
VTLPVTVFTDFSCPYSYVTEASLRDLADVPIAVRYRAFELYPAPSEPEPPRRELGEPRLHEIAALAGLRLGEPGFRPRTRKAHEAARFALEHGREPQLRDEIFAAYWRHERDIERIDVLMELAGAAGLAAQELKIALDIDAHAAAVEHDLDVARRLRIPGTPAIFLGAGRNAVVLLGAHAPAELREHVVDAARAWSEPGKEDG